MIVTAILLVLASSSVATAAAPSVLWEKNTGGENSDIGYAVWQTDDGGYVIAGNVPDSSSSKMYLMKISADGTTQWSKTYGSAAEAYGVRQTADGGYILVGYEGDFCVLYKTDSSGNEQWHKQYSEATSNNGWSVQQTDDGGYIVAGDAYLEDSADGPNWNAWILRTDASGNTLWTKTWGGTEEARLYSVDLANDGGYIFGGTRSNVNDGDTLWNNKPYMVKTDASGNILWEVTYDRDNGDTYEGSYVQQTSDGGYMLAGYHNGNMYLLKVTSSGGKSWDRDYSDAIDNSALSAQQTWDGGYVLAGWTQATPDGGDRDVLIVRTDASGSELWKKRLGGSGENINDEAHSIIQDRDGYYVVTGTTLTYTTGSSGFWDIYYFKLDKDLTPVPDAQVTSDTIPETMDASKTYTVKVTFKNTGTKPWSAYENFKLGYTGDANNFGVTNQTLPIGKIVKPGQEYSFTLTMTAPAMNGTYHPQLQMAWEGHQLFGGKTTRAVRVNNGIRNPNESTVTATPVASASPTVTPSVWPTRSASQSPTVITTAKPGATQQATSSVRPSVTPVPLPTAEQTSSIPCLPAIVLPLLIVGTVTMGLYQRMNKGN